MQEDPYCGLLEMMQKEGAKLNPPAMKVGIVVSLEPLHIKVDEQDLFADDVLIADYLMQGYKREVYCEIEGKISINNGTENTAILNGSTDMTYNPYLKKDDLLALMPMMGEQQYIALARVVKLA